MVCQRLAALSFGKVEPLYFGYLKYRCPEPRVFRAFQKGCLGMPYPRGFRSLSPTRKELEKRSGRSADASPERGGLKPVYLGRLWCPYPEPRVFRAFQSTLLASPLLIRVPEATIRKCPIHKGLRGTYPETPYLRGVAGSPLKMSVDKGAPGKSPAARVCVLVTARVVAPAALPVVISASAAVASGR